MSIVRRIGGVQVWMPSEEPGKSLAGLQQLDPGALGISTVCTNGPWGLTVVAVMA